MKAQSSFLALFAFWFAAAAADPPKPAQTPQDSWVGIYSSTSEIGGFSGTVLAIEKDFRDALQYRMTFYSDVVLANAIKETEKHGDVLTNSDKLYVPTAYGHYLHGKPSLEASVTRYTRLEIKGRKVLLRDDALKAYREHNQLYDYGILIKVADTVDRFAKLDDAKHESIKVLYENPSKKWEDPFVNGPNKR